MQASPVKLGIHPIFTSGQSDQDPSINSKGGGTSGGDFYSSFKVVNESSSTSNLRFGGLIKIFEDLCLDLLDAEKIEE